VPAISTPDGVRAVIKDQPIARSGQRSPRSSPRRRPVHGEEHLVRRRERLKSLCDLFTARNRSLQRILAAFDTDHVSGIVRCQGAFDGVVEELIQERVKIFYELEGEMALSEAALLLR